jgi:hypothetical protein
LNSILLGVGRDEQAGFADRLTSSVFPADIYSSTRVIRNHEGNPYVDDTDAAIYFTGLAQIN